MRLKTDNTSPQGITVSCKNCSVGGTIEISEASFSLPDSESDDDDDGAIEGIIDAVNETIAFFKNGSVEAVATGLFAHIELEFSISESQDLTLLNASLPTVALSPFEVSSSCQSHHEMDHDLTSTFCFFL